jgi:hypothetical protein
MDLTPYVTLEQLRIQARLEPDDTQLDGTLQLYGAAAFHAIESHTGRKLYPAGVALPEDAPENALQATENIQLALLMMVAHWFDNNAAAADGAVAEIPLGFRFLVDPHRWYSL